MTRVSGVPGEDRDLSCDKHSYIFKCFFLYSDGVTPYAFRKQRLK
jgi:hypothetical protein